MRREWEARPGPPSSQASPKPLSILCGPTGCTEHGMGRGIGFSSGWFSYLTDDAAEPQT